MCFEEKGIGSVLCICWHFFSLVSNLLVMVEMLPGRHLFTCGMCHVSWHVYLENWIPLPMGNKMLEWEGESHASPIVYSQTMFSTRKKRIHMAPRPSKDVSMDQNLVPKKVPNRFWPTQGVSFLLLSNTPMDISMEPTTHPGRHCSAEGSRPCHRLHAAPGASQAQRGGEGPGEFHG